LVGAEVIERARDGTLRSAQPTGAGWWVRRRAGRRLRPEVDPTRRLQVI